MRLLIWGIVQRWRATRAPFEVLQGEMPFGVSFFRTVQTQHLSLAKLMR